VESNHTYREDKETYYKFVPFLDLSVKFQTKFGRKFAWALQFFWLLLSKAAELSAIWDNFAGIDCCWRRAPVTGDNEEETQLYDTQRRC
jgi:hypothetical protein